MRGLDKSAFEEDFDEAEGWVTKFDEERQELARRMHRELPITLDSLRALPLDERVTVVERILAQAVRAAEVAYRQVFTENASLLTELAATGVKPPRALTAASRVVLESDLLRAIRREPPDTRALRNLLAESRAENLSFDEATVTFELGLAIDRTTDVLAADPTNDGALGRLIDLVEIARRLKPSFDLSHPQDLVWTVVNEATSTLHKIARDGARIGEWRELDKIMSIRVATGRE